NCLRHTIAELLNVDGLSRWGVADVTKGLKVRGIARDADRRGPHGYDAVIRGRFGRANQTARRSAHRVELQIRDAPGAASSPHAGVIPASAHQGDALVLVSLCGDLLLRRSLLEVRKQEEVSRALQGKAIRRWRVERSAAERHPSPILIALLRGEYELTDVV